MIDSGPYNAPAALLIGVGLLVPGAVSVVGIIAAGGRWAHRTALATLAGSLGLAAVRPIDAAWLVALAATVVSAALLFAPSVTGLIRKLPAATGPPEKAVVLALLLLTVPYSLGMTAWDGADWKHVTVGFAALAATFLFSRVIPGGLIAVRVIWPALAIGLSVPLGLPEGVVSAVSGVVVAVLAWDPAVKSAFHPPRESGTAFPIPPELAPREILDAARIDDRGKET